MLTDYDIYIGIDIGKSFHHAIALLPGSERRAIDRRVTQSEDDIGRLFDEASSYGKVHVAVDQISDVGGLVVAIAKARCIDVGYLPTYTMRQAARLYPGYAKTDVLDAAVIADVSMRIPALIVPIEDDLGRYEELSILASQHVFLVKESTRVQLRMRGMLARLNPQLERAFPRERLFGKLSLELFARYGGPEGFRKAGRSRVAKWASSRPRQCSRALVIVEDIFNALDSQETRIPGTPALERCIAADAKLLQGLFAEIEKLDEEIARLLGEFPESAILRSMPGIGVIWCATIIGAVGDFSRFPSSAHLASYAGLAPGKWESGTSIRGTVRPKGNRQLKNALRQSAQHAAQCDEKSRRYYDKKRSEGRTHGQAITALARRRVDVMYAMVKNGELYAG